MRTKSTITGISNSISLAKTISPGVLFKSDFDTEQRIAWLHAASASSTAWTAVWMSGATWELNLVRRMLATVWCIRSQIEFAVGFLLVISLSRIPHCSNFCLNSQPMNSPPLSWIHEFGLGYLESQTFSNCWVICSEVLLSMRISSVSSNRINTSQRIE